MVSARLVLTPVKSPVRDVQLKELGIIGTAMLFRAEGRGLRSGVLVWIVFSVEAESVRILDGNTSVDAFPTLFECWTGAPEEPWLTESALFAVSTGIGVARLVEERGSLV